MKGESTDLHHRLQRFLLHYRTTPHATTGSSPSELLQGRKLRTAMDLVRPDIYAKVADAQAKQEATFNCKKKMRAFQPNQEIWVQTFSRNEEKWTKGKVLKAVGPVSYLVEIGGKKMRRHVDHMREAIKSQAMTFAPAQVTPDHEDGGTRESTPYTTPVASPERLPSARSSPSQAPASEEPSTSRQPTRSPRPTRNKKPVNRYGQNVYDKN